MVNGIINIYKEKGFTSFDVVAKMRGMFHQKKIGHTGTLDPDAEGVLPVCLGKATKVCDLLTDKDKIYEAVMLLGMETDTQDISGQVLNTSEVTCSEEMVNNAIMSFVGVYEQVPPMYSALKVNGQKLCDLARQGITVERKSRTVNIFSIEVMEMNLPEVRMRVHCSKGTYIRTLCDDIGKKLGCYACMKSLLRTRVSVFNLENAIKLSDLQEMIDLGKDDYVMSIDNLFLDLEKLVSYKEADKFIMNGNKVPIALVDVKNDIDFNSGNDEEARFRLYNSEEVFVGIYAYDKDNELLKPVKIFMDL